MNVKLLWQKNRDRFASYSLRERALIGGAALVVVAMLGSSLLLEPEIRLLKSLQQSVLGKTTEIAQVKAQDASLRARVKIDPDAAARLELEAAKQRLQSANAALLEANAAMIPASGMNATLARILNRQKTLRLVSMRTLPPSSFVDRAGEAKVVESKAQPAFDIYRHGVEIKLTGTYADLYGYVQQLEREKQKFLWGELRVQVGEYPNAELTLVLYTLSMDKAWLSL